MIILLNEMEDLLNRILFGINDESIINVYVDDANNEPFEIYRGQPSGLTQRYLNNALRSTGTFYIFNIYALKNNLSINNHHSLMHRKEFIWLTPLSKPKINDATIYSISVAWGKVRFCGYKDGDIGIKLPKVPIKYALEIAEGHEWSGHGIANYFITDSTYIPNYIPVYQSTDTFETKVTDLKPSTWYHIRIKVTYGGSIIYSRAASCFTKQGIPEKPEKPHVFISALQSSFDPKLLESSYRIKFVWSAPASCGVSITKYHVQIKEITRGSFSEALVKKTKNGVVHSDQFGLEHSPKYIKRVNESPWITVYHNLPCEFLISGPNSNSIEWRIRLRALNAKGWSKFSNELTLSSQQCPALFTAAWTHSHNNNFTR